MIMLWWELRQLQCRKKQLHLRFPFCLNLQPVLPICSHLRRVPSRPPCCYDENACAIFLFKRHDCIRAQRTFESQVCEAYWVKLKQISVELRSIFHHELIRRAPCYSITSFFHCSHSIYQRTAKLWWISHWILP